MTRRLSSTSRATSSVAVLSVASCTLLDMDDETLATVIPFPLHRVRPHPEEPAPEPPSREEYWALVQRLAAQRRDLGRGAG
jgi:hypothetical protein